MALIRSIQPRKGTGSGAPARPIRPLKLNGWESEMASSRLRWLWLAMPRHVGLGGLVPLTEGPGDLSHKRR